jgi:hypothetical protein
MKYYLINENPLAWGHFCQPGLKGKLASPVGLKYA